MLLRQLEYLAALAREQHFGRAAAACHVTQPALSEGIRRLERHLDVQIVRRGRQFEGFTPEGRRVVRWARRILADADELRQDLASMRDGLSGVLRIGAIPTALTVASLITNPFLARHPGVQVSMESLSSRAIVRGLTDFALDVGMTYVDGDPLGAMRTVSLYAERYLLLTPIDGPMAGREQVEWAELAEIPLCLLSPVMQNRRILDQHIAESGGTVTPSVEADTVSVLYAHVATRRWSTVIAHAWLHLFGVPEGMRVVPMARPRRAHHVGLVLAERDPEPMLARAFLTVATEVDLDGQLEDLFRHHVRGSRTTA